MTHTDSGPPAHVIRLATISCVVLAAIAIVGTGAAGAPGIGALLVAGLALGALNHLATDRLYRTGLPFGATSGLRIVVLTILVLGAFVLTGPEHVWPFVLGLGIAQLTLAFSAAYVATRK